MVTIANNRLTYTADKRFRNNERDLQLLRLRVGRIGDIFTLPRPSALLFSPVLLPSNYALSGFGSALF
jgi:hypothetical protein